MKDSDVGLDKEFNRVVVYNSDGGYMTDQTVQSVLLYKILEKLEYIETQLTELNNKTR